MLCARVSKSSIILKEEKKTQKLSHCIKYFWSCMSQWIAIGYWVLFWSWLAIWVVSWVQINMLIQHSWVRSCDFLLSFQYGNTDWRLRAALVSEFLGFFNISVGIWIPTSFNKLSLSCLPIRVNCLYQELQCQQLWKKILSRFYVYYQQKKNFISWEK